MKQKSYQIIGRTAVIFPEVTGFVNKNTQILLYNKKMARNTLAAVDLGIYTQPK